MPINGVNLVFGQYNFSRYIWFCQNATNRNGSLEILNSSLENIFVLLVKQPVALGILPAVQKVTTALAPMNDVEERIPSIKAARMTISRVINSVELYRLE